jgi:hypothetical protein
MGKGKTQPQLFTFVTEKVEREYHPENPDPMEPAVLELWQVWLDNHYHGAYGKRPILNHSRWEILKAALTTYGEDLARQAIIGCRHSPWHSGMNPTGRKYNKLELIFKSETQVKKLAKMAPSTDTTSW